MKRIVENIHKTAYERLTRYLKEKKSCNQPLCELEAANFNTHFPNYADEVHTSLYLMRYAAAYLAEYFLTYKRLFKADFLDSHRLSILSFGSGANLDGLAAYCALREINREVDFSYTGVDKVS